MSTRKTDYRTSLRDFFSILFKWKKWILIFFALVLFVVTAASFTILPSYKATSKLLIKVGRENVFLPTALNRDGLAVNLGNDRNEYINSEIEIIRSVSLAEQVIRQMEPVEVNKMLAGRWPEFFKGLPSKAHASKIEPEEASVYLQKALDVERVIKSNVVQVSYQHADPTFAAEMVNKLCEQYLDRHLNVHRDSKSNKFFKEQADILKKQLDDTERRRIDFKAANNISSLDEERNILLSKVNDQQAILNQTVSLKIEAEQRIKHLKHKLAAVPETILQGKEIDHNPYIISNLQTTLADLELKRKELLAKYTERSRFVKNVDDEIKIIKDKLKVQETKRFGKSIFGLNDNYQRLQEELFHYEAEYEALKTRERIQRSQTKQLLDRIDGMNRVESELNNIQQQATIERQNYQLYLSKYEESRISEAMDKEKIVSVSMVEPAKPPIDPIFPKIKLNILLAALIGLFGGSSLAFMAEYFDDRLEKPEDLEQILELPVLGNIPKLEMRGKKE